VYEKLMGTRKPSPAPGSASAAGSSAKGPEPDAKAKEEAEKLKSQGNAAIQKKDYASAIDFYTKALNLVPLNPIYLSNRAAAYSGTGNHQEAVNDAEMAVAADPKFAKAWSRLGFAKYALGDAKGSMESYKMGIDAEGNGGSDAMRRGFETAKKKAEEEGDVESEDDEDMSRGVGGPGAGAGGMPDLSALAGMFGGGGGGGAPGGGAGGMPNFAEMMNNPMMRQMAQGLMSDPNALQNLMNNPTLRGMMGGAGRGGAPGEEGAPGAGGGMPDLASLMQDPSIMEM
jgi:small glutamine-rich tetratricopeptide repeat-containing protein alpha